MGEKLPIKIHSVPPTGEISPIKGNYTKNTIYTNNIYS